MQDKSKHPAGSFTKKKLGDLFRFGIGLMPLGQTGYRLLEEEAQKKQGKGYNCAITKEVSTCLEKLAKSPSLFIDIGGNRGDYTAEVLLRAPSCSCIIFEPSASNIDTLKRRFHGDNRVRIIGKALSNEDGIKTLYSNVPGSTLASLSERNLEHHGVRMNVIEEVQVVRFDSFCSVNPVPAIIDFVKIDIEGHELHCLEGFGQIINNTRLVQLEFGSCNIDSRIFFKDIWAYFQSHDFILYRITPTGAKEIKVYSEMDECFAHSNLIALNSSINHDLDG